MKDHRWMALVAFTLLTLSGCAGAADPARGDPQPTLALVNGTLIDGTGAAPVPDGVVVIAGERIVTVGPREAVEIPPNARVIDLDGATILPGFINAHVHDAFDADRLAAWAEAGVTTVRDEGLLDSRPLEEVLAWRDKIADQPRYARLVSAGYMLRPPGGYGARTVDSAEAAQTAVDEALDWGAEQIKFAIEEGYAQWTGLPLFEDEVMHAIVEAAHARGARVSVHICDAAYVERALDAGVDDIAHIQWDLVRDDLIQRMVDEEVIVVPTLTVLEAYGTLGGAQMNLRRFVKAGVTVAMGNDYTARPQNNFDHFDLGMPMHEIRRMHEAGMTPMQIIVASTQNGARVCGLASELGTLEAGKMADILVVNGDPLADLERLTDVRMVVRSGSVIVD